MSHRLLVVDCDAVTGLTLKLIFEQEGYEVRTCRSVDEAMKIAETWQPDILIAAMILGGINGLELAKRVVARYPQCHAILLAAQVGTELVTAARLLGFGFYDKPVHPTVLIEEVRVLLGCGTNRA
jgi:two-component system response regulator RstA